MFNWQRRIIVWLPKNRLSKWGMSIVLLAIFVVLLLGKPAEWVQVSFKSPLNGLVVVLDPGHGGPDGGAVSREGVAEEDIDLAIALHLRDYLQESGAFVVMTRDEDEDLADPETRKRKTQDLHRRGDLIKDSKADLFISIHMNAMGASRWSGAQTFYDPRSHPDSGRLAIWLQHELKRHLENTNREAKTVDYLYLLRTANVPSALVEVGFLSNPEEARLLGDAAYQKKAAAAIYSGILRFTSGEALSQDP